MIFSVSINSEAVMARLQGAAGNMRAALRRVITKLSIEVQRSVKEEKLTGQVLHVRTGTLRRSINREVVAEGDSVFAIVGTNVKYGRYWEEGFDMKVGAGARGGPRTLLGMARERYFMKHPPGVKHVAARPFLKPTLEAFEPRIREEIRAAVLGVLR